MQPVRQLNHNYPDILGHGNEHFAVILILLLFLGAEADAFQLGQTIHQHSAGIAKILADLLQRNRCIFHHIMQQRCNNGYDIHLHINDNICDRQRMQNIGLPRFPNLPVMSLIGKLISFPDAEKIFFFYIGAGLFN
ncbi:hypothetical protein D3C80_1242770 [compost metagenome]